MLQLSASRLWLLNQFPDKNWSWKCLLLDYLLICDSIDTNSAVFASSSLHTTSANTAADRQAHSPPSLATAVVHLYNAKHHKRSLLLFQLLLMNTYP